jgi:aminoglycoside phosphotransferase (APT) family kinase protein
MSINQFAKLPEALRETAHAALTASFGALAIDDIRPVLGGVSGALVYRVTVGGRRYVLRMEGLPSPLRNPHQYQSMRIAAEAGIAPRVHYIDDNARVAVMDFIATQPLETYPGGSHGLARAVGEVLARVHALP